MRISLNEEITPRSRGRLTAFWLIALLLASVLACPAPDQEIEISPSLLFTTGSRYLDDVSSVALRGSIDIEGPRGAESGDFSAYLSGRDSLYFLIEGPFNVDLFRMIIIGDESFVKSRDSGSWRHFESDEPLTIEEYGIYNLVPASVAVYLFPQYYLDYSSNDERGLTLRSKRDGLSYLAFSGVGKRSIILKEDMSNLTATYKRLKKFKSGYYPSDVRIFDDNRNWEISMKIEKVRINSEIPLRIWDLST